MPLKKRFVYGKRKYKTKNGFKKKSSADHASSAVEVILHKHDINDKFDVHQEINVNSVDPLSLPTNSINTQDNKCLNPKMSDFNKQYEESSDTHEDNEFDCSYWDDESLFTMKEECKNKVVSAKPKLLNAGAYRKA